MKVVWDVLYLVSTGWIYQATALLHRLGDGDGLARHDRRARLDYNESDKSGGGLLLRDGRG